MILVCLENRAPRIRWLITTIPMVCSQEHTLGALKVRLKVHWIPTIGGISSDLMLLSNPPIR